MPRHRSGGIRPIAAGLLIALAAPPLGLSVILAWFATGQGEFSLGQVPLRSALPASYFVGGIQALFAGGFLGLGIHRRGWISLHAWTALTILLALAPVSFLLLIGGEQGKGSLIYISEFKIASYLIVAALFASLVLRVLIVELGWMRSPP